MTGTRLSVLLVPVLLAAATAPLVSRQAPVNRRDEFERLAQAALARHQGTIIARGVHEPVEVVRDQHGIPHIYARNTHDLFFAQGFTVAQDRMWQLELWRRNGEGKLAEVLGPAYVSRDRFARLLAFRGNWDEEMRKYHPEGPVIFDAFAQGVNAAIQTALDEQKVPVEFGIMGFQPQPQWTAKTLLTRMPGWTLSRNVAGEVQRALDVKALGLEKTRELKPTDPETPFVVPPGLDLEDITADILAVTRGANDIRWDLTPAELRSATLGPEKGPGIGDQGPGSALAEQADYTAGFGSNNWVIGGKKSATGMPIIANDPHREVVNPALRYVVHLNAPGWNAIGATEPGLPGISIGHNDRVAWAFTILGMDQQDLYVEETDPANSKRYRWKGAWEEMTVERTSIVVKGRAEPEVVDLSFTRHGPVLHENTSRRRAYALRWVGAEPGGAGYLGSLNVMQAKSLDEFKAALPRAWYLPSHSLVYADVDGNFAYFGVALTPQRKNWDGLLPVPGKDGQYEWDGFVPFEQLPFSKNDRRGFYNSSNNDVVPRIVPGYKIPLGYEYSAPYRYQRAFEVLSRPQAFTRTDMERLQQDATSLPARALVPLLRRVRTGAQPSVTTRGGQSTVAGTPMAGVTVGGGRPAVALSADAQHAIERLVGRGGAAGWNYVLDKSSTAATIFEYWFLHLQRLAYAPKLPEAQRATFRAFDPRRVIQWMTAPDASYGEHRVQRDAARDRILLQALELAVTDLRKAHGDKWAEIPWGQIHTARFTHPLAGSPATRDLFAIPAVPKSGDAYTLLASSSATETGADQTSGASFAFVFDVKNWDNSTGLNTPGQSAQPRSPYYADLAPRWGNGDYVPLAFSRAAVDRLAAATLQLRPGGERTGR
jgi:penicillin amidase